MLKKFVGSVTRWLDHLFNIWPFTTMKVAPMEYIICKNRLRILPNTELNLNKICQDLKSSTMAKFRQIWSRCRTGGLSNALKSWTFKRTLIWRETEKKRFHKSKIILNSVEWSRGKWAGPPPSFILETFFQAGSPADWNGPPSSNLMFFMIKDLFEIWKRSIVKKNPIRQLRFDFQFKNGPF